MFGPFNGMDTYKTQLSIRSATEAGAAHINHGSRVLLPPTVLDQLVVKALVSPWQFKIETHRHRVVYCGVLTFDALPGEIVVPDWMFRHLGVKPSAVIQLTSCSLPHGTLIKIQPHESSFIELSDPRAVLERKLADYTVLTKGSVIEISFADHTFHLGITDILRGKDTSLDAIVTVRADTQAVELKVDFERALDAPPSPEEKPLDTSSPTGRNVVGSGNAIQFKPINFKPPSLDDDDAKKGSAEEKQDSAAAPAAAPAIVPFAGAGRSLRSGTSASASPPPVPGAPASAAGPATAQASSPTGEAAPAKVPFSGKGRSLKD